MDVDATVISVKGIALPGEICRSAKQRERKKTCRASNAERRCEGLAEVSRGHSRSAFDLDRRPKRVVKERSFHFEGEGDADKEGREAQISW